MRPQDYREYLDALLDAIDEFDGPPVVEPEAAPRPWVLTPPPRPPELPTGQLRT